MLPFGLLVRPLRLMPTPLPLPLVLFLDSTVSSHPSQPQALNMEIASSRQMEPSSPTVNMPLGTRCKTTYHPSAPKSTFLALTVLSSSTGFQRCVLPTVFHEMRPTCRSVSWTSTSPFPPSRSPVVVSSLLEQPAFSSAPNLKIDADFALLTLPVCATISTNPGSLALPRLPCWKPSSGGWHRLLPSVSCSAWCCRWQTRLAKATTVLGPYSTLT
mmetsp:Transcript_6526/g.21132  ORF Transcript_6526/g.21132 Transcript_6526/m.21132 type:complete len:215 (+) Transcript_6526:329-973(+)